MLHRKPPQRLFSLRRQMKMDFTSIARTLDASNRPTFHHPVREFHSAVMPDLQPVCNFPDGRLPALRQPLDGEQKLVLVGLQSVFPRGFFAESQEPADLMPEFGKGPIAGGGKVRGRGSRQVISYHDISGRRLFVPVSSGQKIQSPPPAEIRSL